MPYPADLKYTKEHEWIKVDGTSATIGITHYAQESLGDIVFVELPKPGSEITAGKTFGTVESVKAVSDLYAPASGTVNEVNGELATVPEKVLARRYGDCKDKSLLLVTFLRSMGIEANPALTHTEMGPAMDRRGTPE